MASVVHHGKTLFERVFDGHQGREFVLDVDIEVGRRARVARATAVRPTGCPPGRKRLAAAYVRRQWREHGPRLFFGHVLPEKDTLYAFKVTMVWDGGDTAEFRAKCTLQISTVQGD